MFASGLSAFFRKQVLIIAKCFLVHVHNLTLYYPCLVNESFYFHFQLYFPIQLLQFYWKHVVKRSNNDLFYTNSLLWLYLGSSDQSRVSVAQAINIQYSHAVLIFCFFFNMDLLIYFNNLFFPLSFVPQPITLSILFSL